MAYNISGTEKKIILHSPSMIQIFQKANLLAYNQASVLIYGESSLISSKRTVPWSAASKSPVFPLAEAPVKALGE